MERAFRIAVVEDSETQAYKLRLLLEEQGWEVSIAGAAEGALAALGDPLPDLILVDYICRACGAMNSAGAFE